MSQELDKRLLFSRQFIITDTPISVYTFWNSNKFASFNIYTHPLLNTNYVSNENKKTELFLIGYVFNPYDGLKDEKQILYDVINAAGNFNDICKAIANLSGRFVLVLSFDNTFYIFNDPGGLRSVYYTKYENKIYIGSQPGIFSKFIELEKTQNYFEFVNSSYYKTNVDFALPCGVTLYKNLNHLVPNHYLNISTFQQYRFWPSESIKPRVLDESVGEISNLFSNLLIQAHNRFELSLPLTAGYDSRTILSFCKPFINDVYIYTLKYRQLTESSDDIQIPRLLTESIKTPHNLLSCQIEMNQKFLDTYSNSVDLYHPDWAQIAYGLQLNYPQNKLMLKGACSEIVKCWYHNLINKKDIYSGFHLAKLETGWEKMNFITEAIELWLIDAKQICMDANINILDLFVWEHRIGNWQANCQLEWDIVQEVFSPFNTRPILELMLGIDTKYRQNDKPIFLEKIIDHSWKELNQFPANPRKFSTIIKNKTKLFLTKNNLYTR
jgi:hypothetical protein